MASSMQKKISILIPVYNSEKIVDKTVTILLAEFRKLPYHHEIILVNDGSPDNSWQVIQKIAQSTPTVKAINLLKNYGQHTAVFCGMGYATGDYLVTMDDDLQNPPSEIIKLIQKIEEGHDVVFGRFPQKKHAEYRKLGSKFVNYLNGKIFGKPKDLVLSNFRIFTKDVAKRVLGYKTNYPYIPGLLLMHANTFANVETEHHARSIGSSNYTFFRIFRLVSRLLINYSSYPLNFLTGVGIATAILSFINGAFIFVKALYNSTNVPGWASIMIVLSLLNGLTIIMLGIIGIYISRTLNQISSANSFFVKEVVSSDFEYET